MNIRVICVGKTRAPLLLPVQDYEKRMAKYCKYEVIELKECICDSPQKEMEKEEKSIMKHIKDGEVICLDSHGRKYSSEEFADRMKMNGRITFIIGSHVGLSENLKKKYPCMSFGAITLPHQIARLVLAEQIYRAQTILNNEHYHK